MTTALIVFLNVFFIAFVLVTVLGLVAWGIMSDRTTTGFDRGSAGALAGRDAAPRAAPDRAGAPSAAPHPRPRRVDSSADTRFGKGRRAFGRRPFAVGGRGG